MQTPVRFAFTVKNWPKNSLDGISRAVDCEVHRPCWSGSLTRGEQPREPRISDAGPERAHLKEEGFGLGWATSTHGCDLMGFSSSSFFFLQVGFLDIKHRVPNPPKTFLSLADDVACETSVSGWEVVPIGRLHRGPGFDGLSVHSCSQKIKVRKEPPYRSIRN